MGMKFGNSKRYGMRKRNISGLMATNYGVPFASPVKDPGHGGTPGHSDDEHPKDNKGDIIWEDEVEVSKSIDKKSNEQGGETTTTTTGYETKGTSSKEHPKLTTFKDRCAKFNKTNSPEAKAAGCVWDDDKTDPKPIIEKHVKGRSEVNVDKTKKKKCECQSYKADGSKGPMVEYPCGGMKNPNCSKRPTTKTCSCKNRKTKEDITYKCGTPIPDACKSRVELKYKDCDKSKHNCSDKQKFSWKKCRCVRRDEVKNVRYKKNKKCKKNKSGICYSDITIGTKYGKGGS